MEIVVYSRIVGNDRTLFISLYNSHADIVLTQKGIHGTTKTQKAMILLFQSFDL